MLNTTNPIAVLAEPNGLVAEAYRNLRVSVSRQLGRHKKMLAVVSVWPGDGKSMVCTNLAVVLSQLHVKVLLVDADLRRPTISRIFSAERKLGLTDALDTGTLQHGYKSKIPNLFVLPRGVCEKNPANLLSPERIDKTFDGLRQVYDFIVLDTPPMSACSDALLLGSASDGALMVVSPKGWDGDVEVRYKQQLVSHEIPLIGAVLNGAGNLDQSGYGYGYGAYGKGYGVYGSPEPTRKSSKSKVSWPWKRFEDA